MSSEEDHFPGDLLTPIFDSDLLQPIEEDIEDLLPDDEPPCKEEIKDLLFNDVQFKEEDFKDYLLDDEQPNERDIEDLLPVYDEVKKQIEKLQTPPNVTQYLVEPATTPDFKTNMLSGKRLIR